MPILEIGDKSVEIDDSFLKLSTEQQNAMVAKIAESLGIGAEPAPLKEPEAPITTNRVVRAAARGVPIVGGLLNEANAVTNAALAPVLNPLFDEQDQLKGDFSERRAKSLEMQTKDDEAFAAENPVTNIAAELAGGVGATIPVAATSVGAKALGLTGKTLPQQVLQGAASGAGIGIADAATRGTDPNIAGGVGAVTGAAMPVVGRGIGAAARAIKGPPPVEQIADQVVDVAGRPVRMSRANLTGDAADYAVEHDAEKGARGLAAQTELNNWRAAQQAEMQGAVDNFTGRLDPSGQSAGATPFEAGSRVRDELAAAQRAASAAEGQRVAAIDAEGQAIPGALGGPQTDAFGAAGMIGEALRGAARAARATRTAAYRALSRVEGTWNPAALDRMGTTIRRDLVGREQPIIVNERTANARDALDMIDNDIGRRQYVNDAQTGQPMIGPDGRPIDAPITPNMVENVRQRLIAMQRDANQAARGPNGNGADAHAMRQIIEAFDEHLARGLQAGGFSGDADAYANALARARRLHREYRQTFTARNTDDRAGKMLEKIMGRDGNDEPTPDGIARILFGNEQGIPGGEVAYQVGRRIEQIVGRESPEFQAYRQAVWDQLTERGPGRAPYTPAQQADRIDRFLTGRDSRLMAHDTFTPAERARLQAHANQLRTREALPAGARGDVEKAMDRISGADGGPRATPEEVMRLISDTDDVALVNRLKRQLTPESWTAVRQAKINELITPGEGQTQWGPQRVSENVLKFLNKKTSLAEAMFSAQEIADMRLIAQTYKRMVPTPGATNPSGTGSMLERIARRASTVILPLLGFSQGGMVGAGVGIVADRALRKAADSRAARDITTRLYGAQPRAPARTSNVPSIVTRGAMPALLD